MNTRLETTLRTPSSEARGRPLADTVLELIWVQKQMSRAEIARRTGLSRSTVSEIVSGLLKTGLIAEIGDGPSRGGRRPIVLEFQKYIFLHREGLMSDDSFAMFENDVIANLLSPGGAEWWRNTKGKHPEVSAYIDQRIEALRGKVEPTHTDFAGIFGEAHRVDP